MKSEDLKPNKILRGPIFPEPVQVIMATPMANAVKLFAKGLHSSRLYDPILTPEKLALLESTPDTEPFDGDSQMFRLGIEAMRLQLAFESRHRQGQSPVHSTQRPNNRVPDQRPGMGFL